MVNILSLRILKAFLSLAVCASVKKGTKVVLNVPSANNRLNRFGIRYAT